MSFSYDCCDVALYAVEELGDFEYCSRLDLHLILVIAVYCHPSINLLHRFEQNKVHKAATASVSASQDIGGLRLELAASAFFVYANFDQRPERFGILYSANRDAERKDMARLAAEGRTSI